MGALHVTQADHNCDSIYAVPVGDKWLVHAPLADVSALANRAAIDALLSGRAGGELADSLSAVRHEAPAPRDGPPRPAFVGLLPTRRCNIACRYCGFGADTAPEDEMDLGLAAACVDAAAEYALSSGRSDLSIHFFGGEPFCAPKVVEVAVYRGRMLAAEKGLTPTFEIATNGVCSPQTAGFLADHFTTVVLSFDGGADAQNRLRPGRQGENTFETVARTAEILSEGSADLILRVCVTRETTQAMAPTAREFASRYRPSGITFEPLKPTEQSRSAGLVPPDPWEFAAHFIRASREARAHGIDTLFGAALPTAPRLSFCPVGNDSLIVWPGGQVTACYLPPEEWQARGMNLTLGKAGLTGMDVEQDALDRVRKLVAAKPRCERCFCRWSCAGGCHVSNTFPGCSLDYEPFCIETRLLTACRLLEEMGCEAEIDPLLCDRRAMERLALHPSDRLEDWNDGA